MLNNTRFPNWYWEKVKGIPRGNGHSNFSSIERVCLYSVASPSNVCIDFFLKAQLWSPSIKVLQKPLTAYQIKNESLGGSVKVSRNMTPRPSSPVKKALQIAQHLNYFCPCRLPTYWCLFSLLVFCKPLCKDSPKSGKGLQLIFNNLLISSPIAPLGKCVILEKAPTQQMLNLAHSGTTASTCLCHLE